MIYTIGATSFAALCSIVWLTLGGSVVSAIWLYLISGQIAMITLVARSAFTHRRAEIKK